MRTGCKKMEKKRNSRMPNSQEHSRKARHRRRGAPRAAARTAPGHPRRAPRGVPAAGKRPHSRASVTPPRVLWLTSPRCPGSSQMRPRKALSRMVQRLPMLPLPSAWHHVRGDVAGKEKELAPCWSAAVWDAIGFGTGSRETG